MRPRSLPFCLMTAVVGALFAQTIFSPRAAGQKKNPLVWSTPVTIARVPKKDRKPVRPLPRVQQAPLLTLQWQVVERGQDNRAIEVDPKKVFETGDQLKLAIATNQDGYLYIIHHMDGADGMVVFPDPRINNGRNEVKKNQQYLIPSYCPDYPDPNDCWWEMAPPAGDENFIVIFSRDMITSLPNEVTQPGGMVKEDVIKELQATSRQSVKQEKGRLPIPGRENINLATRVQNINRKDNEELITTISIKHGE